MSVVFLVDSEQQLSGGSQWCQRACEVSEMPARTFVLGSGRKTLLELTKRRMSEQLSLAAEKVDVRSVESNAAAILAAARSVGCKLLLIVYRSDGADLQRQLFEESMFATLWVRTDGQPPSEPRDVVAMFRRSNLITSIASEQVLGFSPAGALCETADLEKDDLVALVNAQLKPESHSESTLIICGIEEADDSDRIYQAGLSLLSQSHDCSLALAHRGHTVVESIASKIRHWADAIAPPMQRDQRIALAQDLQSGSQPNLEFLGLMSASAMLASFGLLQDSAAVIIGAMLIAPLMTPILGAGMALTQGNRPLFRSSLWTIAMGFVGALAASVLFGWLFLVFQERTITSEMWARSQPSPLDFCVGLVGGMAASYARTRSHLSSALAGAAIAAALVPPISTAGLQIAFGQWDASQAGVPVAGPLLLVAVNVLTIMIGSSFVLWTRGMRGDGTILSKDRWGLRMLALLVTLALLILIWVLHPFPEP